MTVGLSSTNLITKWLNVLRNTAAAAVPQPYVQLHTNAGDPGSAGTSNISAGSTTRVAATFAAPSGNAIGLTGTLPQWTNGGTSETIGYISVWDATSAGNFQFSAQLTTAKAWASGDTLTLNTLSLSLGPAAA